MNQNEQNHTTERTTGANAQPSANTAGHPMPADATLLRPCDAAKLLAVSERTLWALSAPRGSLSMVRMGKTVRYLRDDVLAWARKQSQGAA